MTLKYLVLVFCVCFASSESGFVDIFENNKCSINDNECQRKLFTLFFQHNAKTGVPELSIPPFDPYEVKNISTPVLGLVDIGMVDGVAKGIRNCRFGFVNTSMENLHFTIEVTCDFTIKGRYKVLSDNPLTKNLLGGATVHGDGYAKIKIEKMHMIIEYDFFVKEKDGEIYFDWNDDTFSYKNDYGKVSFAANNLYFGNIDVSQTIISILNDNWKFIITTFAKPFTDIAMKITNAYARNFFTRVPSNVYLTDDMSAYLDN